MSNQFNEADHPRDHGKFAKKDRHDAGQIDDLDGSTYPSYAGFLAEGDTIIGEDGEEHQITRIGFGGYGDYNITTDDGVTRTMKGDQQVQVVDTDAEVDEKCPLCHQPIDYCSGHGEFNSSEACAAENIKEGDAVWNDEYQEPLMVTEVRRGIDEYHFVGPDGKRVVAKGGEELQTLRGPALKSYAPVFNRVATAGQAWRGRDAIVENANRLYEGQPAHAAIEYFGKNVNVSGYVHREGENVSLVDLDGRKITDIYSPEYNNYTPMNLHTVMAHSPVTRRIDEDGYYERYDGLAAHSAWNFYQKGDVVEVSWPDGGHSMVETKGMVAANDGNRITIHTSDGQEHIVNKDTFVNGEAELRFKG